MTDKSVGSGFSRLINFKISLTLPPESHLKMHFELHLNRTVQWNFIYFSDGLFAC